MLTSDDPREAARQCVSQIRNDATSEYLAKEITPGALVCVNGWSPDVMHALALASDMNHDLEPNGDIEVCVVDGDNGADYMVRCLERLDIGVHLVNPAHGGAAAAASDIILLSAFATGVSTAWCNSGSLALASVGYCAQRKVVLSAAVGTRLPEVLFAGIVNDLDASSAGSPWRRGADEVPFDLCAQVVVSDGPCDMVTLLANGMKPQCLPATELLIRSAI